MAVSYSNRIRSLRKKLKMTQKQMADEMGIPKRTIENWEAGVRSCPEWAERLVVAELYRIKDRKE